MSVMDTLLYLGIWIELSILVGFHAGPNMRD